MFEVRLERKIKNQGNVRGKNVDMMCVIKVNGNPLPTRAQRSVSRAMVSQESNAFLEFNKKVGDGAYEKA